MVDRDPIVYMGVDCETFFQSLLDKQSDEIKYTPGALGKRRPSGVLTRIEKYLAATSYFIEDLPSSINFIEPPKSFNDAISRHNGRECNHYYYREHGQGVGLEIV